MSRFLHPLGCLLTLTLLACEAPEKQLEPPKPEPAAPAPPPPTGAERVPPGKRASYFTLPLSRAAFGDLSRGDRVDILGTFPTTYNAPTPEAPDATVESYTTMTLLQNVAVLDTFALTGGMLTASLSLTLKEAVLLETSLGRGSFDFLVRNREDIETKGVLRKTLKEVLLDLELIQKKRQRRLKKRKGDAAVPADPSVIAPGMRSVALPLNLPTAAIGTFRPGDHVDILGRFDVGTLGRFGGDATTPSLGKNFTSMTLLQGVKILSVHPEHGGLTLELTVEEAEMLTISQTRGALTAHLRNPGDPVVKGVLRQTLKEILLDLELHTCSHPHHRKRRKKPTTCGPGKKRVDGKCVSIIIKGAAP